MARSFRKVGVVAMALMMVFAMTVGAFAAAGDSTDVSVAFYKETTDEASMANEGVDTDRQATLTEEEGGTYTLTLPIKMVSKMSSTGYLSGLSINGTAYEASVSGDVANGTGVLTVVGLPSTVKVADGTADSAIAVTCEITMDMGILGQHPVSSDARMCIW